MPATQELESILGYEFDDQGLAAECLVHGSSPGIEGQPRTHSHRGLAYVGDAAIELAIRARQYVAREHQKTGVFTQEKQTVVTNAQLGARAIELGFAQILQRASTHEFPNSSERVWADAFEAAIGAVFLDGGYENAATVVHRLLKFD